VITFATVGRSEAATLERPVREALEAAVPGDRVLFVDSASSDGSGSTSPTTASPASRAKSTTSAARLRVPATWTPSRVN
jgi:hypothetical protein